MTIRTRLRALILITLLPVALLGVLGTYRLVEKERETLERGARDRVRTLTTAIDAELRASITPLELLARSPSLDRDDFGAFRAEAARALEARRGDWSNVLLSHPDTAQMVFNLVLADRAALPETLDPQTILEAARTGRPTVSPIIVAPSLKRPVFTVRVPVVRDGRTRYVLSAAVNPSVIARLIERQSFPAGWAVAVLDANYRFVMRQPSPAQGSEFASESLKQALAGSAEGWQRGRLLDGAEIYRAFQRSSISGWSTSIAIPRSVVDQGLQATWLFFAGVLVAAALGLWIAWVVAARIARPIAALAAAAPALGRGDAAALPAPAPIDEVRELSHALREAAFAIREREERQRLAEQALRAADRAKDEFLAMLGHELRNPLASVSNAAQLLKIGQREPAVLDHVSEILGRQVEHMTHLVDDLLEVGRVTGGKIRLERAPLDLARVADELIETWRSGGRFLHHAVRTELEPAWVLADRARIEQVISNLLDNALKYTPAGGEIRLRVHPRDGKAVLELSDTGEGMPPDLIGRVFDLFVQGERSLAREPGGLGIGLTMAKRLVELHDGTIRAASAGRGAGATFTVALPAIERPSAVSSAAAVKPSAAEPRKGSLLIVEDNRDGRESLAALLRHGGHAVHVAENARAGLEAAQALRPDVALIDIGLPDLDGYELARRLRSEPATARIRLIALTGYGTRDDRRRALAAGFDEHLVKPVEFAALEALLRQLAAAA